MTTVQVIAIDIDNTKYVSIKQEISDADKEEMIDFLMETKSQLGEFICMKTEKGVLSLPKDRIKSIEYAVED